MKPLFYSDYLEGAHPLILEALFRTNMEQTPGYGTDDYCKSAADSIRKACAREDAHVHFLVGGTQTNATVINSILKSWQAVVCATTGHIAVHETGAIEHGGHKVITLPSHNGKLDASELDSYLENTMVKDPSEHAPQPAMVYISLPTELGTVYNLAELEAIATTAHRYGLPLFVDGARLGYGLTASNCDITLDKLASLADVFYIGGTKQGALFGEAVVFCNPALGKDFRFAMKQNGGLLAKGRLLGIQFCTLFTDNLYFLISTKANAQAVRIREAAVQAGIRLFGDSSTNQSFLILPDNVLEPLSEKVGFEFWERYDESHSVVRFCTSWATTDEAVDVLISAISSLKTL